MRIVILGSVALPVPPVFQGGTERIAYAQAVGLAQKGHEVILIAAKGSQTSTSYELVAIGGGDTVTGSSQASQMEEFVESSRKMRKEMVYLAQVSEWLLNNEKRFDAILNNMRGEAVFLPVAKRIQKPFTTVMHLPLFAELAGLFEEYKTPVITISNAQRKGFPGLHYAGTAYNGVDLTEFPFEEKRGAYLLIMGSIAPHKNQAAAIRVAKKLSMKLILAGKIGDERYFNEEIAPHIDNTTVVHKGELSHEEKVSLYQHARALLFPILWEEPFGLVMIEAMACGTPVVAFNRGAVPEVVIDGKTGFIVGKEEEMVDAVGKISSIDRGACRKHVETHFSVENMVDEYERILSSVISRYSSSR